MPDKADKADKAPAVSVFCLACPTMKDQDHLTGLLLPFPINQHGKVEPHKNQAVEASLGIIEATPLLKGVLYSQSDSLLNRILFCFW